MILAIQCVILCTLFTLIIIPSLYKNPISHIMSYPPEIRKRVESLPQYAGIIKKEEKNHLFKKLAAIPIFAIILSIAAYFSGARTFTSAFIHTFVLFFSVNLYDLIILDLGIFCHSKRAMIPGTEDMTAAYKNPRHHIIASLIGTILAVIEGLLSGGLVILYNYI